MNILRNSTQFEEPSLDLGPRWVGTIAEHPALPPKFSANLRRQFRGRKKRIASGKAHLIGIEIIPRKVDPADPVVVGFDVRIFA